MFRKFLRPRFTDSRSETIWLTVYADLMTNLTLVFLALFGLTLMGDAAVREAIISLRMADLARDVEGRKLTDFENLTFQLRQELDGNPNILITEETGIARITFGENVLFDSGRAELKPTSPDVLKTVAEKLAILPYTVVVEGHTDPRPLARGSAYKNNWELSLARAMSVVRFFIDEGELESGQLAAAAYGYHRPRANNETALGQRQNRRVEIALLKDFPYESTRSLP